MLAFVPLVFLSVSTTIHGAEMHERRSAHERVTDFDAARRQQGLCYIHHFGGASNGLRIDQLGEILSRLRGEAGPPSLDAGDLLEIWSVVISAILIVADCRYRVSLVPNMPVMHPRNVLNR